MNSITESLQKAIANNKVFFKNHAVKRMIERNISSDDVIVVLKNFVIVENYIDDKPFPSYLVLGYVNHRPLHVVMSLDEDNNDIFIITVYEPAPEIWGDDFKTRRK